MSFLGKLKKQIAQVRATLEARQAAGDSNPYEKYRDDPEGFAREVLRVRLTPQQKQIAELLLVPPFRVLVPSANAQGKTLLAAVVILWWHCTRIPAKILSTAPTAQAVEKGMWNEIRALINQAGIVVPILPKACEIKRGPNDWAIGTTAQKEGGFKGKHGPNQWFVFEEATDILRFFWSATETMFQPPGHAWLVIFNPTDPASRVFAEYSSTLRAGSTPSWHVVRLSALEHPNIAAQLAGSPPPYPHAATLETLERRIPETCQLIAGQPLVTDIQWPPPDAVGYLARTKQSPQWWRPGPEAEATILGRFPSQGAYAVWGDGDWLAACRELPGLKPLDIPLTVIPEIGCDTAAGGTDDTEFHVRCGPCSMAHDRINGHDTMQIVGRLIELAREWAKWFNTRLIEHPPAGRPKQITPFDIPLKIDDAPVGYGVLDRLREQGYNVIGICAAHRALDPERYPNKRSELWFVTAERSRRGELDLSRLPVRWREELGRQAKSCSYKLNSRGQREVTPKDKLKELLGRSPDSLDAINICYAGTGVHEMPECFGGPARRT